MTSESSPNDWAWLDDIAGALDEDFVQAVEEQPGPRERPALDEFFG